MEIKELIKLCKESNAGILQAVFRDTLDSPALGAIIILDGKGTQEVLDAIDIITTEWHKDCEPGAITEAGMTFDKHKEELTAGFKTKV